MDNYWVFPITEDNLTICLKHSVIGVSGYAEKRARNIQPGDHIVFYVSRKFYSQFMPRVREFQAEVVCIGPPFKSKNNIFKGSYNKIWFKSEEQTFPTRLPIEIINQKKCAIVPLIKNLSFIKNKKNWGSAFLGGLRQISVDDFNLILKSMN
jgi:predicted RNA-binding protein